MREKTSAILQIHHMHTIYGYVPHHIATWTTCYKWCTIHEYMVPTGYGTYNSLQYHARMVCGYDAHIWSAPFQSSSDMITWNKRWEEKHRDKLRADNIDNGRAYSPRCSTQMFKLHGTSSSFETTCANALTKSILNKWRLIWQTWRSFRHFAGWTALTARVFSRVKNLKRLQHLRHSTLPSSTVPKGLHAHQQSSLDIYRT